MRQKLFNVTSSVTHKCLAQLITQQSAVWAYAVPAHHPMVAVFV
jgi:hypothetical protein